MNVVFLEMDFTIAVVSLDISVNMNHYLFGTKYSRMSQVRFVENSF